jgi:uncharacterized damage-inducible protein DinB
MARSAAAPALAESELLPGIYLLSDQMNQLLLDHLDPQAWRAQPPGSKTRTIVAIFSHMHNVRRKWVRLSAPQLKLPAQLDRNRSTPRQAKAALAESAARCAEMLSAALAGRVKHFRRDGWARPWPPNAAMLAYMLSHDAHHRGQVCLLAHQLGFRLPAPAASWIWNWEKLWRDCGLDPRALRIS